MAKSVYIRTPDSDRLLVDHSLQVSGTLFVPVFSGAPTLHSNPDQAGAVGCKDGKLIIYNGSSWKQAGIEIDDTSIVLNETWSSSKINSEITAAAWTQTKFDDAFALKSTSYLAEGTNLYYTNSRADARIAAARNVANGIAGLDSSGYIPASLLYSYVDDVIEAATFSALPATGESGKIYVTIDTNFQYRWSGSVYIQLVASPGSTDAVPEGSLNLYFTNTRVQTYSDTRYSQLSHTHTFASLTSKPTTLTGYGITDAYPILGNPSGFLTGITSLQVTGALGFTPYNNTNPNSYISGINSGMVTTALGFTPYDNTNPAGYITSSGSITGSAGSVAWTNVTGKPTHLSQYTNDLGNYGGWITSINSGMVTTALGFTPYNNTNPAGYITSSGSITGSAGSVAWTNVTGKPTHLSQFTNDLGNYGGWITGINSGMVTTALGFTPYNNTNPAGYITSSGSITGSAGSTTVFMSSSHAGAYWLLNNWDGTYWNITSNHGAGVRTAYADASGSVAWTNVTGKPTHLSQFTNDLGNYGGWISGINSSMVTTALGFTPYNNTNPAGYITSASLSGLASTSYVDGKVSDKLTEIIEFPATSAFTANTMTVYILTASYYAITLPANLDPGEYISFVATSDVNNYDILQANTFDQISYNGTSTTEGPTGYLNAAGGGNCIKIRCVDVFGFDGCKWVVENTSGGGTLLL